MRITGAAAALGVARVAALAGHDLVSSWWAPAAYLWQDAATILAYGAIDHALRRLPRAAWSAFGVFVAYVAITVPVTRVMSTPMTWTMWRAAGGALSDSVWAYVTAANILWVAIAAVAASVPLVLSLSKDERAARGSTSSPRVWMSLGWPCAAFCLAVAALGPSARTHVDTRGLDRNAWSALVLTALPRSPAVLAVVRSAGISGSRDWRTGPHGRPAASDLASFSGAAAQRNVILISLESTAAQYLSLYGAPDDVMPNLSGLARSAIVFDNAYAVYPESIKGLHSILCSTYPAFDRAAEEYARAPCAPLASRLADDGFHTALFHSGRFDYLGMDAVVRGRGFDVLADAGDIGGDHESSFGVDDRATAARLLDWIDTVPRGDRFFAAYLPIAGHHPYESPEPGPFPASDEFGRYRNALRYGDTALGELINGIASRGLSERTLWIVLGDHGEAFGQHDGNFGHTFQLYEENVRVPFLIAAPGMIHRQIRAPHVVSLIDTAPTILDLLGMPAERTYQGASALSSEPRMALFFADYSLGLLGLRDGRFKYIYELESGRSRLFDLERDPAEAHDLAADHAETRRWYSQRVLSWASARRSN